MKCYFLLKAILPRALFHIFILFYCVFQSEIVKAGITDSLHLEENFITSVIPDGWKLNNCTFIKQSPFDGNYCLYLQDKAEIIIKPLDGVGILSFYVKRSSSCNFGLKIEIKQWFGEWEVLEKINPYFENEQNLSIQLKVPDNGVKIKISSYNLNGNSSGYILVDNIKVTKYQTDKFYMNLSTDTLNFKVCNSNNIQQLSIGIKTRNQTHYLKLESNNPHFIVEQSIVNINDSLINVLFIPITEIESLGTIKIMGENLISSIFIKITGKGKNAIWFEDFEKGSAALNLTDQYPLCSMSEWHLHNSLLVSGELDNKIDKQSIRIKKGGFIENVYCKLNGIGNIIIKHANFPSHINSSFKIQVAVDGGSYNDIGNTIFSNSIFSETIFKINIPGRIKIKILNTSDNNQSINIDNIEMSDYSPENIFSGDNKEWSDSKAWSNGKIPELTDDVLLISPCIISGNAYCRNIKFANTGKLYLTGSANLYSSGLIDNQDASRIIVESFETGKIGTLIFQNKPPHVTLKQYINTKQTDSSLTYKLVGFPLSNIGEIDIVKTFKGAFIDKYCESNSTWLRYGNNFTFDKLEMGIGYALNFKNNQEIILKGQLYNNDFRYNLFYTPDKLTNYAGYNLIGNPYMAAIPLSAFKFEHDVDKCIWIWDNQKNRYNTYPLYTVESGMIDNIEIPPFQGYWVKASGKDCNLQIKYSDLVKNEEALYQNNQQEETAFKIDIKVSDGDNSDELIIIKNEFSTSEYDNGRDGFKFMNPLNLFPNIFAIENQLYYAIDVKPDIRETNLGFIPYKNGIYKISINANSDTNKILLCDFKENKIIDFSNLNQYEFFASVGDETNRFKLIIDNSWTVTNQNNENIDLYSYNNTVIIGGISGRYKINVYTYKGTLYAIHYDTNKFNIHDNGLYIITIITNTGIFTKKIIIN